MTIKDNIYHILRTLPYPGLTRDIVSFGLVEGVAEHQGQVELRLAMAHLPAETQAEIRTAISTALAALPAVQGVTLRIGTPAFAAKPRHQPTGPRPLAQVGAVIAVGSGKGGVGKSTTAVNLAVALARRGLRVGLLDADVHGPNLPRMLGLQTLPPSQNGQLVPAEAHGLKLMSLGLMAGTEQAVIWRGPMVDKLIREFFDRVAWGTLDILVVDLPPGTGDAQLALTRRVALDGAIIVSTPQAVALEDAIRGLQMFRQVNVPILGLVENMNLFECPNCFHQTHLFEHGTVRAAAARLSVPFLAEVPILPALRAGADTGHPAATDPHSAAGLIFAGLAEAVLAQLAAQQLPASAPSMEPAA
jgi:ATP-binding protein involved in chromosome partitioning